MKLRFLFFLLVLAGAQAQADIVFFQFSDTHWGFNNASINPDYAGTLKKAIAQVNGIQGRPDFAIFTGDETHTTDDPALRRQRMQEFKDIISALDIPVVKFLPGEHDAALDNAQAYREFFGEPYYSFDLKGVHFICLDNVSDAESSLGDAQLAWLEKVLAGFDKSSQIILFAHRPLLEVYSQWDWRTRDGSRALALLRPFTNVTLFYGHIHQLRKDTAESFTQYAAQGLMFPLPAPGSVAKPGPLPWDPQHPYQGLGFRAVRINTTTHEITVTEYPIEAKTSERLPEKSRTVSIVSKRWEFTPSVIHLKKNVPVTLSITSLDARHGFSIPDLGLDVVAVPGHATQVALTPDKPGEYSFACDVFCGDGHEGMAGRIIVE